MRSRSAKSFKGIQQPSNYYPTANNPFAINQPYFRGMMYGKANVYDLPDGWNVMGQFAFLSDRNFQEVYFYDSYINGLNQDTYIHVKNQQGNYAVTLRSRHRDGRLVHAHQLAAAPGRVPDGANLLAPRPARRFARLQQSHNAGYAELRPTIQAPYAYLPTDVRTNTVRLDSMSDVAMPFDAGPFKIAPT